MKVGVNIMMKLRKIWALVLAVAMIALTGAAFATSAGLDQDKSLIDNSTVISEQGVLQSGTDNGSGTAATYASVGNTVTIEKDLIVFNSDSNTVYEPNVTYTYTLTAVGTAGQAISGATITDEYSVSSAVLGGVIGAASSTTATVTFGGSETVDTSAAGEVISDTFTFSFTPANFPHAGVYRYLITETDTTAPRADAGVISGANYVATRYLDVYVMNNAAGTGLEIYGFVVFESDSSTQALNTTNADTYKTNGYVVNDESDLTDTTDCDYYWTVNLDVEKVVTGQLGDKVNEFPFAIALASPVSAFVKADFSDDSTTATTGTTAFSSGTYTVSCTLNDGATMSIVGLPVGTTATVTETNNTPDIYTVSAAHDNGATLKVNDEDSDTVAGSGTGAVTTLTVYNTTDNTTPVASGQIAATAVTDTIDTITVTNDISAVSPTGYVARFAPYALMLIGGIALLIVAKKHRRHAEEEDK